MSNNGSQHLAALTRDEVTAPLVNLVPLDLPGDLYKYIAEHVWGRLARIVNDLSEFEISCCESYIDKLIALKRAITEAEPRSEERKELINRIKRLKDENCLFADMSSAVYWMRVKDLKERRKICKRNIMTLPLIQAEAKEGEFREHPFAMGNPEPSLRRKMFEGAETIM